MEEETVRLEQDLAAVRRNHSRRCSEGGKCYEKLKINVQAKRTLSTVLKKLTIQVKAMLCKRRNRAISPRFRWTTLTILIFPRAAESAG